MTTDAAGYAGAEPQAVLSPLTGAAIFLVVVVNPGRRSTGTVRGPGTRSRSSSRSGSSGGRSWPTSSWTSP